MNDEQNAAQEAWADFTSGVTRNYGTYKPTYSPNGAGGVNYLFAGLPITREQYAEATGEDVGAIENSVKSASGATSAPTTYSGPTAAEKAAEQAEYTNQINTINNLLGIVGSQRTSGKASIANQRNTAMTGFANQETQNNKDRQAGIETVDRYAGNNLTQLRNLFQGAGAGNSSASRDLAPYLIAKSAGARRTGVVNTAGENAQNIDTARNQTTTEFDDKEREFLSALLQKEVELKSKLSSAQIAKNIATGGGYNSAMAASAATRASQGADTAAIEGLLSKYTPTAKTASLESYQVDPAKLVTQGQGMPSESSYYLSQLYNKKKQQEVA